MDFSASLDDLYYYAMVVKHGGFAAAGRELGVPKSRLSRHVNRLEERLGVRLLQRSTRRFVVTDTGENLYRHCQAMLAEAESAFEVVEQAQSEPRGLLRVACPIALASTQLAPLIPRFLRRYPKVRLDLHVDNRRIDVLAERFDAALRVRTEPSGEDGLVMRRFAELCELLVASPDYLEQTGQPAHPDDLRRLSTLSFAPGETQHWTLNGPNGQQVDIEHAPRLLSHNFPVLRQAALDGLGIALLPASVIEADLASGRLVHVLPDWRLPQGVLHVVFPSRRGLLPAVRAFIDFLVDELPPMLQGAH
ncbi:MAG: LysR substrate-binding domain-containing protein [Lysobacteraceae bacterium]|nr:LysR substrate-binding domain-containing protein [Xanthomonadaceae bacterium]HRX99078.1 LysR substrate-binding domain-containing protein [Xanthomonadaceae bacterium]